MERRFVLFLILAFVIFMGYMLLMRQLYPPKPKAKGDIAANKEPAKAAKPGEAPKENEPALKEAQQQPAEPDAEQTAATEEKKPEEKAPEIKAVEVVAPEEPAIAEEWVSLGSADPKDPYRMLVTLTNRGAALTRIELSSLRYRDIDDRSGYLGHLVMDKSIQGEGLPVQVVGAGTPAAEAGIKVGDVIKAIKGKTITKYADLEGADSLLAKTKPGQKVEIKVLRDNKELTLSAKLIRRPLSTVSPEDDDPLSFLLTLQQIDKEKIPDDEKDKAVELERELKGIKLRTSTWEKVEADQTHVVFSKKVPKYNLEILKTYSLAKVPEGEMYKADCKAYSLEFSIKIVNRGETERKVAYRLDGANGLPKEGYWYANKVSRNWGGSGLRDVVVSFEQNVPKMIGCQALSSSDKRDPPWQDQSLTYIGVDAQYFSVVMIPILDKPNDIWFASSQPLRVGTVDTNHPNLTNISFRVTSLLKELKPGQEISHKFEIFTGPKRPPLLDKYGLSELIYYGWPVFAGPAMLLSMILHFFYAIVCNYGLAIILLTVLVRGCMFPLSKRQALGAQKMQELQPEIKRLTEKYKTDMKARSEAQQELFRKHNYNPLSGCLVVFIQLPVFIGLYRSLMVDIELRDAPLILPAVRWCSNLAAPDMLFNWSPIMPGFMSFIVNGPGLFWLGPYFNILPILTIILFIWQQKKFMPPAADEQAAMQQKIMQYMMIFMGVLFFKVASGLCIYFIASSLWSLAERKFLPKSSHAAGALAAAKSPPNGNATASRGKKNKGKK
jgi:YidC/Oxa1 family membrane protein insertase